MNQKDRLQEATILALQNKLNLKESTNSTKSKLNENKYKVVYKCWDEKPAYEEEISDLFDTKQDALKRMKEAAEQELKQLTEIEDTDNKLYTLDTTGNTYIIYKGDDKVTEYRIENSDYVVESKTKKTEGKTFNFTDETEFGSMSNTDALDTLNDLVTYFELFSLEDSFEAGVDKEELKLYREVSQDLDAIANKLTTYWENNG